MMVKWLLVVGLLGQVRAQRSFEVGSSPLHKPLRPIPGRDVYITEEEEMSDDLPRQGLVDDGYAYSNEYAPREASIPSQPREPLDLAGKYRGIPSLLLVSVSTIFSGFAILSVLCKMVLSFVPTWMTLLLSLIMAISVFTPSHLGAFSKALGVVCIELIRNGKPVHFISDMNRYISAALNLKDRKPYPPGDNPWKYEPDPEDRRALEYSQYQAMGASIAIGAITGWSATKPIPLVPSWIVGLGLGLSSGYMSTLKDSRGDLVRFMGNTVVLTVEEIRGLSEDVKLGLKFSRVSSQTTMFLNRLDAKYKIVSKCKVLLTSVMGFANMAMNRYE